MAIVKPGSFHAPTAPAKYHVSRIYLEADGETESEHRRAAECCNRSAAELEASSQGCPATLGQGVRTGPGGVRVQGGEGGDSSGRDVSAGSLVLPVPPIPALASPAECRPAQAALPKASPGEFSCFGLAGVDTTSRYILPV